MLLWLHTLRIYKSLLPCPTCCSSTTQTPSLTRVRSACRLNSFLGFHVLKPSPTQSTQLAVWPGPSISLTPTTTHQSPPPVTLKVYTVLKGSDLLHPLAIMVSACLCLGLITTMSPPTQTHCPSSLGQGPCCQKPCLFLWLDCSSAQVFIPIAREHTPAADLAPRPSSLHG